VLILQLIKGNNEVVAAPGTVGFPIAGLVDTGFVMTALEVHHADATEAKIRCHFGG